MNTVLVIAAHPDDEVLGCGGAICKHVSNGDLVHTLIVAEGATSRHPHRNIDQSSFELSHLIKSAEQAAEILGVSTLQFLGSPDNRLDSLDRLDLIKKIESSIHAVNPSIVYTHHSGDVNIDHRRIHEAVVTACRPIPGQPVRRLLSMEISSSTDWQTPYSQPPFIPNWYVDISPFLRKKLQALEAYSIEMRPWPHSRSVEALEHLARLRGAQIGVDAAEAFSLLRCIES